MEIGRILEAGTLCLLLAAGAGPGNPPPTTSGLESYRAAREVLDAGVNAIGGLDAVIAGADTVKFARTIQALGLQMERIIPVHGTPATMEALNKGLAVRATYSR